MKRITRIFNFSLIIFSAVVLLFFLTWVTGLSQAEEAEEIDMLKKELSGVQKKLEEIMKPYQSSPKPNLSASKDGIIDVNGDPFLGNPKAPITLIEFSDYQCSFCRKYYKNTLPLIKKKYIETGKVKYTFKDFPLAIHNQAQKAAEASECAGEQGKYWKMHDLIFDNQSNIKVEDLKIYANKIGLNISDFKSCLDKGKYFNVVKADMEDGKKSGVRGTPSFLLGKSNNDGKISGKLIVGAQPFENFEREIESLLQKP